MTVYDIAMIGAGPAGTAAAITAARAGQRVLVLDKDEFPRHKVCGEFISFESTRLLQSLLPEQVTRSFPEIRRVRLFRGDQVYEGALRAPALSIPRFDLDAMLLEAARQSGAEVHLRRRVLRVKQQADGITIETDAGEVSACRVINASGRWSELRAERSLPDERWIGIKQHFVEAQPPASTDLYFFTGGYCGVQPVAADRVNVSALVRAQDARTLADMIVRSAALTRRSHAWTPVSETITTAPIVFGAPRPVSQGMANVGDAAAFIDPFLGDGIAIALQTGVLAARCLCHGSLERYRAEYLGAIEPALRRAAILRSLSRSSLAWTMMKVPGMVGITARATRARFPVSA